MKRRNFVLLIIIILGLSISGSIWYSYHTLKVNTFELKEDKADSLIHMVVLADLHDNVFEEKNEKLVKKVLDQHPDFVLMPGDMLNGKSKDASIPCELISQLSKEVPVYFSLGNHEIDYINNGHPELIKEIEAAGAVVLEEDYIDLVVNGIPVRLGGMYSYAFGNDGEDHAEATPEPTKTFLKEFQSTDSLKIMMAHRPDSFIFGDASKVWDIDLVVSGHIHGGQVVLPFLGGLYGGDQGFFPEYVHGMYKKDKIHMFLTSGLGSHIEKLPRFNNPPEIAVINIEK